MDFDELINSARDPFTKVVRAHYVVDKLLDQILESALPRADKLEVERIAFLLKVDFSVALEILLPQARPILASLNTVRNKFAHNPFHEFSESDCRDAKNTIAANYPQLAVSPWIDSKEPEEILEWLLSSAYVIADIGKERVIRGKAATQALNQMIAERVSWPPNPNSPAALELERRIQEIMTSRGTRG